MLVRRHSTALAALAMSLAMGAVTHIAAQSTPTAGYVYVTRVIADMPGQRTGDTLVVARTRVLGDSARVEIEAGNKEFLALLGTGAYLVTNDGGQTVAIVTPQRKTYVVIEMKTLGQLIGAEMKANENGKLEQTLLALASHAADTLLGLAVEHRSIERKLRSRKGTDSVSMPKEVDEKQEWWTSVDLPRLIDPVGSAFRIMFGALVPADRAAAAQFAGDVGPAASRFFLRWEQRVAVTTPSASSPLETHTRRIEVIELTRTPIAADQFTIPTDYRQEQP